MEALLITDAHIRNEKEALELRNFLDSSGFEKIICLGDLFDNTVLAKKFGHIFKDITWIKGNHELLLNLPEKLELSLNGSKLLLIHGHQFFPWNLWSNTVDYFLENFFLRFPEVWEKFSEIRGRNIAVEDFFARRIAKVLANVQRINVDADFVVMGHLHAFAVKNSKPVVVVLPRFPGYAVLRKDELRVYEGERIFKLKLKA